MKYMYGKCSIWKKEFVITFGRIGLLYVKIKR